eukprot:scaffold717_cov101-Isochrysis_galbana.AAC.1
MGAMYRSVPATAHPSWTSMPVPSASAAARASRCRCIIADRLSAPGADETTARSESGRTGLDSFGAGLSPDVGAARQQRSRQPAMNGPRIVRSDRAGHPYK